jgi:hypothetical protein
MNADLMDDELFRLIENCPPIDPTTYRPIGEPESAQPESQKVGRNSRRRARLKQIRAARVRHRQDWQGRQGDSLAASFLSPHFR